MAPKQKPNDGNGSWEDWQDYHSPDKSRIFEYKDSTEENIGNGESQKFHYQGNDLPEKE